MHNELLETPMTSGLNLKVVVQMNALLLILVVSVALTMA